MLLLQLQHLQLHNLPPMRPKVHIIAKHLPARRFMQITIIPMLKLLQQNLLILYLRVLASLNRQHLPLLHLGLP